VGKRGGGGTEAMKHTSDLLHEKTTAVSGKKQIGIYIGGRTTPLAALGGKKELQ